MKKRTKRIVFSLVLLLAFIPLIPTAIDAESETIRWVTIADWEPILEEINDKYTEKTGVNIEIETYSFNDLFEVIETKANSGSSDFDVMSVDVTFVAKYGENGYLEPLDPYFTEEELDRWTDTDRMSGNWKDTQYAIPMNTSAQMLWYNQSLLDEAGVEVRENGPDNRLTYEEVAELAKQTLDALDPDRVKGIIGFDFQQVSRLYQMNMLPNSMGGENIGEDGLTVDGIINTEPWIDSMKWYQSIVEAGIASVGYGTYELREMFYTGQMVFMVGPTWVPSDIKADFELGYAYAPCFEGFEDEVATATGSWYLGINSNSEYKDISADFIKDYALGESNDLWYELHNDMPARKDLLAEITAPDSAVEEFLQIGAYEAMNTAKPRAVTPAFGEYHTIMNQTWEDVRNGANVEEALDTAVEQIDAATAVYR